MSIQMMPENHDSIQEGRCFQVARQHPLLSRCLDLHYRISDRIPYVMELMIHDTDLILSINSIFGLFKELSPA